VGWHLFVELRAKRVEFGLQFRNGRFELRNGVEFVVGVVGICLLVGLFFDLNYALTGISNLLVELRLDGVDTVRELSLDRVSCL